MRLAEGKAEIDAIPAAEKSAQTAEARHQAHQIQSEKDARYRLKYMRQLDELTSSQVYESTV